MKCMSLFNRILLITMVFGGFLTISGESFAQNFAEILKDDKSSTASETTSQTPGSAVEQAQAPQVPASPTEAIPVPKSAQNSAELSDAEIMNMVANPSAPATVAGEVDDSKYTLGDNDLIEIIVARHPEVSKQYSINSEGKIQYDFVGDIYLRGMTKKEAKDVIVEKLSTYIVTPDVTVKIIGYNSKVVYVIGEVAAPGKIFMRGDTITVREALLQSGLPLLSASTRKCRLITPSTKGKADTKFVDVFKLIYEGDLKEDLVMKPGDMLYVPATALSKAMRVISPVTQPAVTASGAAREVTTPIRPGL